MNQNDCAMTQAKVKESALDQAIHALKDEVFRYENNLYRLIEKLEAPQPSSGSDCEKPPKPITIDLALSELYSRLVNANEGLSRTIKRIEEQVGEFKLLP